MRLGRWLSERAPFLSGNRRPPSPSLAETRLIVLDVDVTGINLRRDYATGVAILEIKAGTFSLGDLTHCSIAPPDDADWAGRFRAMVDFIGDSPVLTYNARFVKHMIKHAARRHALPLPLGLWIDIGAALYGTVGKESNEIEAMARWQERMKIAASHEHSAVADVFALAQMVQTLIAYCEDLGISTLDDLRRAQNARVWLKG